MKTSLLISDKQDLTKKLRRVRTLTMESIEEILEQEKGNFTPDELQAIHANGGDYKAEFASLFLGFIRNFSRKSRGLFMPLKAQETVLVPIDWTVESDDLESEINLSNLNFSYTPCRSDEYYISGDEMLKRVSKTDNIVGSLGFGKLVLDEQAAGQQVLPKELQGQKYIILPRTILQSGDGRRRVSYLHWLDGQWMLDFYWLGISFISDGVAPRTRE